MAEIIRQLHKTSVAAQMLCLSQGHLHRLKDSQDGPLKEGEHWFSGIAPNSPIKWDVEAIQQLLHVAARLVVSLTRPSLRLASVHPTCRRLGDAEAYSTQTHRRLADA